MSFKITRRKDGGIGKVFSTSGSVVRTPFASKAGRDARQKRVDAIICRTLPLLEEAVALEKQQTEVRKREFSTIEARQRRVAELRAKYKQD